MTRDSQNVASPGASNALAHAPAPKAGKGMAKGKKVVTPVKNTKSTPVRKLTAPLDGVACKGKGKGKGKAKGDGKAFRLKDVLSSPQTAIVLIDVQGDFMEGGSLAVPGADYKGYVPAVQQFINACRAAGKLYITQSQDFHPAGHSSFASTHKQPPMSVVTLRLPNGDPIEQVMWPDHCVQGTNGAKLLIEPQAGEFVQQKGTNKAVDSYSAFFDVGGHSTNFVPHLQSKGIKNVVVLGVASDFCVNFSATDAVTSGFKTFAVTDLCRSVDPAYDIVTEYRKKGVTCVTSADCLAEMGAPAQAKSAKGKGRGVPVAAPPSPIATQGAPSIKDVLTSPQTAIVLIDFQYDFMEGGPLAVANADYATYAPAVREFMARCRGQGALHITQSQDWHPARHQSFASTHRKEPMSVLKLTLPSGEPFDQVMWPDHCVQGTDGAKLLIPPRDGEFTQQKGGYWRVDSYSAFFDVSGKSTFFSTYLRNKHIKNVVCLGLAGDYCVNFSVMDAVKCGFNTFAVVDLCRSVDPAYNITAEYSKKGVTPITSAGCYAALPPVSASPAQAKAAPRIHSAPRRVKS